MSIDLLDLSPCGLNPISLEDALKHPDRARMIELDEPSKKILKLRRVYKLDLGGIAPPPWIGELRYLRAITCMADMKKLPPAVLALPRLRYLFLDDSSLESLDGVEKLQALDTITLGRTPVQGADGALAAAANKIKGARATSWSIEVRRKAAKPPRDKKKLLKLIADDAIEDCADLTGVDLAGETLEDLFVTQDFSKAKLAGTTWLRCDFQYTKFHGADLSGATFESCYFSSRFGDDGDFAKAKFVGATFKNCGGTLSFAGSDLTRARFVEMDSDVHYDFSKAKAPGIELHATFCSEKEHAITAKGADMTGAKVTFDVTPDRRAEIAKKKSSKFAWKKDHLKGAKTDKATQVTYVELGQSKEKPGKPKPGAIDEKGPSVQALGSIHAPNAGLWLLAIDAADAGAWRGSVDEDDKNDDFQRALRGDGPIKVGKTKGLVFAVNHTNGWSHVWQVDGGIALLDWSMHVDDKKVQEKALGVRLAQWPVPKKPAKLGTVTVHSGLLALMLPYRDGVFADADRKKAKKAFWRDKECDRALVPLPNGTYNVVSHTFGPTPNYEDEIGEYYTVTRIVQSS